MGIFLQFTHPDVLVIGKTLIRLRRAGAAVEAAACVSCSSRISSQHNHESVVGVMKMLMNSRAGVSPPSGSGLVMASTVPVGI